MAEERDDPVPTDDPRDTETSEQNAEESHPRATPDKGDRGPSPDARARRASRRATPVRRQGAPTRELVLSAAPASAAPNLLAQWTLDEGSGQVVGDASGQGSTGQLGASADPDGADPGWIAGHDSGSALAFDGSSYVTIPDTGMLEPSELAVDAWVRVQGSPGRWRYVLSKGSLGCNRSAYGLYSGWGGGMAFYVSSQSEYTISPEISPSTVWNGAWHHVIGSYDGHRVRLWIDGTQVGAGTPVSMAIAYTTGSKGTYLGIYRGSCDLGFSGAIDDVSGA